MGRYSKIIIFMFLILLAADGCRKDEIIPVLEGSGISDTSWSGTVSADEDGEILSLTFFSEGKWTAESSAPSWCRLLTENGVAGSAALRIEVAVSCTGCTNGLAVLYTQSCSRSPHCSIAGRHCNAGTSNGRMQMAGRSGRTILRR